MADIVSKEKRSYMMSRIHSKNTKPELIVRKYLFHRGFRYRVNVKKLPDSPDIVFEKYKTIIFINGCFWHGHSNCKIAHIPKSNTKKWIHKIQKNIDRDLSNRITLMKMGWHILTVWECQLSPSKREKTLLSIELSLCKRIIESYK